MDEELDLEVSYSNITWSDKQKFMLVIVSGCIGCVSCVTCMIAISAVFYLKLYTMFTYRLAMYQVLSGMLFSIGVIFSFGTINYTAGNITVHMAVCKAQAVLTQYFLLVKIMFTMNLIFHLFCLAVFLKNFKKLEPVYVVSSIMVPLFVSWIPLLSDNLNYFGVVGGWCWINSWEQSDYYIMAHQNDTTKKSIEHFTLMYSPLFICLVIGTVLSIAITVVLLWRIHAGKLRIASLVTWQGPADRQPLLDNNAVVKRQVKVLKELLPLVAYPAIIVGNAIVLIVVRAAWNDKDYAPIMVQYTIISSIGFISGLLLIIHILIVYFYKWKKLPPHVSTTGVGTRYIIPNESEIDALIEGRT